MIAGHKFHHISLGVFPKCWLVMTIFSCKWFQTVLNDQLTKQPKQLLLSLLPAVAPPLLPTVLWLVIGYDPTGYTMATSLSLVTSHDFYCFSNGHWSMNQLKPNQPFNQSYLLITCFSSMNTTIVDSSWPTHQPNCPGPGEDRSPEGRTFEYHFAAESLHRSTSPAGNMPWRTGRGWWSNIFVEMHSTHVWRYMKTTTWIYCSTCCRKYFYVEMPIFRRAKTNILCGPMHFFLHGDMFFSPRIAT